MHDSVVVFARSSLMMLVIEKFPYQLPFSIQNSFRVYRVTEIFIVTVTLVAKSVLHIAGFRMNQNFENTRCMCRQCEDLSPVILPLLCPQSLFHWNFFNLNPCSARDLAPCVWSYQFKDIFLDGYPESNLKEVTMRFLFASICTQHISFSVKGG